MTTEPNEMTEREYVYCGIRLDTKGHKVICIRLIGDNDTLEKERLFDLKKGHERTVGHVYKAEFNATHARGLTDAKWSRQWPVLTDRIQWDAEENRALADYRATKMEAERGKVSDIERALKPLRAAYAGYMKRGDYSGAPALENHMLTVLHRPLRKDE